MNENENTTDAKAMPPASDGSVAAAIAELRRLREDAKRNRANSGGLARIAGSKWDGFIQGIDACIDRLDMKKATTLVGESLTNEESVLLWFFHGYCEGKRDEASGGGDHKLAVWWSGKRDAVAAMQSRLG